MSTKNNFKRVMALTFAVTCLSAMMTGCSKMGKSPVESYDHTLMMSYDQVKKNSAADLAYDNYLGRERAIKIEYNWDDVTAEKSEQLQQLVATCQDVLAGDKYVADKETKKIIPKDTYNYIKGTIDGYALTNGTIKDVKGTLGYYYVDVEYDIKPQSPGKFKENVDMLGLNGTWQLRTDGSYTISDNYLSTAVYRLNQYFLDNRMPYEAAYQVSTGLLSIYESNTKVQVKEVSNNVPDEVDIEETTEEMTDATEAPETTEATEAETVAATDADGNPVLDDDGNPVFETVEPEEDATEATTEERENLFETEEKQYEEVDKVDTALDLNPNAHREPILPGDVQEGKENSIVSPERKIRLDIDFVNNVVGYSLDQAYLPELGLVYTIPKKDGDICGYGIYPEGINGLRVFDYDRNSMTGKLTMRYMFKDTVTGNGKMTGYNIYVTNIDINNGIGKASEDNEVATFTMTQLQNTIDRSDRVMANCDIPGLMLGNVYEDIGYGVLRAYRDQSTNQLLYMSTIRQVLQRDTTNHCYLIDVETTVQEGSKAADCYGMYTDKYLMVIQQQGENFVISDSVRYSRELKQEPTINPDSTTQKRLMALNLSGKIDDATKQDLSGLLSNLYTAVNNRILWGRINGEGYEEEPVDFGVYDCFNQDVAMVSTDEFLDMTSVLTDSTIKKGADTPSKMIGRPTQWIGGTSNQAEFITAEFIEYEGFDEAYYADVYYLVSKMGDYWVIDERRVIDEVMVSDAEGTKSQYKSYAESSSASKPNFAPPAEGEGEGEDAAPAEGEGEGEDAAPAEGGDAAPAEG